MRPKRRTATDGSGEFSFNSLPASEYNLSLDAGPDYEPLRKSVVIYGNTGNVGLGRSNNFQIDGMDNNDLSVAGPALFSESARAGNRKKAVGELNSALAAHPNFPMALRSKQL